jgi:hypothetical protein
MNPVAETGGENARLPQRLRPGYLGALRSLLGARTLNLSKLTPVLAALILAGCYGPAPPLPPPMMPPTIAAGQGIDLATDTSDVLNELKGSRLEFVARYYRDPDSGWPPLSASEAQRLSALGVKIVAVWEWHSADPTRFSYAAGYGDAVAAYTQAKAVGQPPGSAIYFAVDHNIPSRSMVAIDEYFRGVNAGLTAASGGIAGYKIGVYGSGAVCDAVKRAGLAQYSWLSNSFAWAGSTTYDDWNIRQGDRRSELSFNNDSDEAREDYGAFQVAGGSMPFPGDGVAAPGAAYGNPAGVPVAVGGPAFTSAAIPVR